MGGCLRLSLIRRLKTACRSLRRLGEIAFSGSGRILVMDDEVLIRQVAAKILKHLGYSAVV
jgi:hypothetical protein